MNCPNCGAPLDNGAKFCASCGTKIQNAPRPAAQAQNVGNPQFIVNVENSLPYQYRPLGAWAYFGYAFLFSIPIIGFICLIIFSLNDDNINRRNFARSYWCALIIIVILSILFAVLVATTGVAFSVTDYISDLL